MLYTKIHVSVVKCFISAQSVRKRHFNLFGIYFQIGFAAADAVTGLKLIEAGVPKEKLALLGNFLFC